MGAAAGNSANALPPGPGEIGKTMCKTGKMEKIMGKIRGKIMGKMGRITGKIMRKIRKKIMGK